MDLADLWAQHKKFILAVAGSLLLLLIGRGWLTSKFPVEEIRSGAGKDADKMRKAEEVPDSMVRAVEEEVAALKARYAELAGAMRFKVGEDFVLPPGEQNARLFFFNKQRQIQKALVDAAERQDIRVPDALGLKDMAPTDTEEIRRTLVALDLIQQVLIESLGAGIRRIEAIRIEEAQRGRAASSGFLKELRVDFDVVGGERSLRALVAGLVDGAAKGRSSWLAIDKARLRPVKGEEGMLVLNLTLVALQIEKSEDEETP